MNHYDVLIVTPGSSVVAQYVKSLSETLAECQRRGLTYKWLNGQGSLVYFAREVALTGDSHLNPDDRGPLHDKVTYNKVFWIDSDIEWTVSDFFKLYESDHEVICGAYLLGDRTTTSVHAWGKVGGIPKKEILKMKSPLKIQSMGFGFVAMKSGVFERIPRPWFTHFPQAMRNSRGEEVQTILGEDISWCIKAFQVGIDIYFDPKVLVNHIKTQTVRWD